MIYDSRKYGKVKMHTSMDESNYELNQNLIEVNNEIVGINMEQISKSLKLK